MKQHKSAIRSRMSAQRRALPPLRVAAAGAAVRGHLHTTTFFRRAEALVSYFEDDNEIPTEALHRDCLDAGRPLFVPNFSGDMVFRRWSPGARMAQRCGIPMPIDGEVIVYDRPTVVLVPLVAWDDRGVRLGRGGGFYDRAFADKPASVDLVGLAYEFQHDSQIPVEDWDVRLDHVVTENRVIGCLPGDAMNPASAGTTAFMENQ